MSKRKTIIGSTLTYLKSRKTPATRAETVRAVTKAMNLSQTISHTRTVHRSLNKLILSGSVSNLGGNGRNGRYVSLV